MLVFQELITSLRSYGFFSGMKNPEVPLLKELDDELKQINVLAITNGSIVIGGKHFAFNEIRKDVLEISFSVKKEVKACQLENQFLTVIMNNDVVTLMVPKVVIEVVKNDNDKYTVTVFLRKN